MSAPTPAMDPQTKARLLRLAREAVKAQVEGSAPPPVPEDIHVQSSGVFVTLNRGHELRGCLGTLGGDEDVVGAVVHLAAAVTHEDPRFLPVTPGELPELHIELSVLTPREQVHDAREVEIGRHGLVIRQGARQGLLLPQVATEHRWDRETFLDHACLKAGLPRNAWRHGASIFRFEADVFGAPFTAL